MQRPSAVALARRAARYAPAVVAVAALAFVTIRAVLDAAGGPAVPLDDSYIHFQYARSVAELHPFRYTPGAAPTPGATSLLWPLVLAPFHAVGFRGAALVWPAWILGFTCLALLSVETKRLAEGLVPAGAEWIAGLFTVAFGGFAWFAASGMEVVPFALLLTRTTRRTAEWLEAPDPDLAAGRPKPAELATLAVLCPLMRPEGAVLSVAVALALALRPQGGRRRFAVVALSGPLAPTLVAYVATGQAALSTAIAKWLPLNPYYPWDRLVAAVLGNVKLYFGTLMNGELWTSVFLPEGGAWVGVLALVALPAAGVLGNRLPRALLVLGLALTALVPTTYETFLVNRVRYIWPFTPGWVVGLAALAGLLGRGAVRASRGVIASAETRAKLSAFVAVAAAAPVAVRLAAMLAPSIADLASCCRAISLQQVWLGKWAREGLPEGARIGLNDTGAIAYFSGHPTFDVVGLTTRGEARYWTAGPASRFEHYERLAPAERPSHFIVYPEWFGADPLLGEELASRTVRHTILGGATMSAHVARYDAIGTGELPTSSGARGRTLLDVVDVADLESEARHRYELLGTTQQSNRVYFDGERADGARFDRELDRFALRLSPGGLFLARVDSENPGELVVRADGKRLGSAKVAGGPWQETAVAVPGDVTPAIHEIEVEMPGERFGSLHYWSYE